ncbi:hypothetical protein Pint_32799 [Pistacia integerrima]|uniref:Uncharacterized protein n=1 Tax=Pistacia integerrima TaxID=434235 RepID=A0ACC0XMA3_9ROSI|nr:hypothetical protein Pint_32799 [Pistacia integerrima]
MDSFLQELHGSMYGFKFDNGSISSVFQNLNLESGDSTCPHPPFIPTSSQLPIDSAPFSDANPNGDSPYNACDDDDSANAVLKYISEMLMGEELEDKNCMLQDSLALQAAEKSFYDVLGQKYPPSPNQILPCFNQNIYSPDDYFIMGSSNNSSNSYTIASSLVESNYICDQTLLQSSLINSPFSTFLVPDLYSQIQPFEWFRGGIGEAGKGHLNGGVNFAAQSNLLKPSKPEVVAVTMAEKTISYSPPDGLGGLKIYQRDDNDYLEDGRSKKHPAFSLADPEETEMYDDVLLSNAENNNSELCSLHGPLQNRSSEELQHNRQGRTKHTKKKRGNRREVVDLRNLLTQCAQAVVSYEQRTANELLKQIKQHSSAIGDGTQRMAHYFVNGLEARLDGTETPAYSPTVSNRISAADILKVYRLIISVCPFKEMSIFLSNKTIMKLSEKATRLHIIDFGILCGFQWPNLIQCLSARPGGPPKLRITGIEFPQPGFRPAERVEETGRRLKRYCERFNVPFEYNVIVQKWDTIQVEDINIDRDEMTVVNCLYRMKSIPDETVDFVNSPRDIVLRLIKRINPDIFIHGVVNGTYSAPFFITRFREALFHFSALFDMLEATIPREDQQRLMFEREIFGRDIMNVIACEDIQRIERPETYKKWQVRNVRAGFRQLPLDKEILREMKSIVKSGYHSDFVIDEDGKWILQGWKGRVSYALSCWKPIQDQE